VKRSFVATGLVPSRPVSVLAILVSLLAGAHAQADVSETLLSVTAASPSGVCSYSIDADEGQWDPNTQELTWYLATPVDFFDPNSGQLVASLTSGFLRVRATQDCLVDLDLAVQAGPSDTAFIITSPLVSFDTVPAAYAEARATATFTVTHLSGPYACLIGLEGDGTGAFRVYHNGYAADGIRFTHLVGAVCVDGGGVAEGTQFDPASGFRPVGADVWGVSTEIAFTLTAGDYASATTITDMPEPEPCPGDLFVDGFVDSVDLAEFLGHYGTSVGDAGYDPAADLNHNGSVDLADLAELMSLYGSSC
jgi:hypothetical protein